MIRLDDFEADMYSQFGEDGVIAHIFAVIGEGGRTCVEFGAADGVTCSNTCTLWSDRGWDAVLIEPDYDRRNQLLHQAAFDLDNTIIRSDFVTPTGPSSIDAILADEKIDRVDFMSIDVDGPDWYILEAMTIRPRVVCIEFNPTIPPTIDVRQATPDQAFGASLLAMVNLAPKKGYRFIGATYCNAFLVVEEEAGPFDEYETDPTVLFPADNYSFVVTDFQGRSVVVGSPLPWGPTLPYVHGLAGAEGPVETRPVTDDVALIRRSFEAEYGPAVWIEPEQIHPDMVAKCLSGQHRLVGVDLSNFPGLDDATWILETAAAQGRRTQIVGRVLAIIHPGDR